MRVLMTSFLAVYEFYHIHKDIGMLSQKTSTNIFSAVGCFLHFSSFGKSQLNFYERARQDLSVGWAMPFSPPGYVVDHLLILSL